MKRFVLVFLVAILVVFSAACDKEKEEPSNEQSSQVESVAVKDVDVNEVLSAVTDRYITDTGDFYATGKEELDEDLISSKYGDGLKTPDFSCIESYAVYFCESGLPPEAGIFKLADANNAQTVIDFINRRFEKMLANAENYPEINKEPIKNVIIKQYGKYVYYIATETANSAAEEIILSKLR